jgi:hypothetical protein
VSQLWMRSSFDLHNTLLAFFQAFVVCMVFTSVFKFYAGRPRPDQYVLASLLRLIAFQLRYAVGFSWH